MSNSTALRLYDTVSRERVIVQDGKVYAERDGKISKATELAADAPRRQALLSAAGYFNDICDPRVAGNKSADGTVVTEAMLNKAELQEFEKGGGTAAKRPLLESHLSIFDRNNRGKFNIK